MEKVKNVLVVGATGGTGRAVVEDLVLQGYHVTAFSRSAESLPIASPNFKGVNGNAMNVSDIGSVMEGQDAVIVTLGISSNPLTLRLFGKANTALKVRSEGTRNVITAMKQCGVKRLIVQSSYGVGETRNLLRLMDWLVFSLLLKPQIADTEVQEQIVRKSELDWVLVQPVNLTDGEKAEEPFSSLDGTVQEWKVTRKSVGRFLTSILSKPELYGRSVSLSGVRGG